MYASTLHAGLTTLPDARPPTMRHGGDTLLLQRPATATRSTELFVDDRALAYDAGTGRFRLRLAAALPEPQALEVRGVDVDLRGQPALVAGAGFDVEVFAAGVLPEEEEGGESETTGGLAARMALYRMREEPFHHAYPEKLRRADGRGLTAGDVLGCEVAAQCRRRAPAAPAGAARYAPSSHALATAAAVLADLQAWAAATQPALTASLGADGHFVLGNASADAALRLRWVGAPGEDLGASLARQLFGVEARALVLAPGASWRAPASPELPALRYALLHLSDQWPRDHQQGVLHALDARDGGRDAVARVWLAGADAGGGGGFLSATLANGRLAPTTRRYLTGPQHLGGLRDLELWLTDERGAPLRPRGFCATFRVTHL